MTVVEQRSLAGKAAAAVMTAAERQERGRRAIAARWEKMRKQRAIKMSAITKAAEADPERYGDLLVILAAKGKVDDVYTTLQSRKQEEVLPGPNPYQVAHGDPARRWSKSVHDLLVLMRSVRENAGGDILRLTRQWSPAARHSYGEQLQEICATLELWITALHWKEEYNATE